MGIEVLVGASIVSGLAGVASAEKSRSAQKKASKKQERQSRLQSARDAMSQVRQQRIAQASIQQGAATQGTQSSSAAQGGYSAVGSLTSGNMQFLNQMDSMNSQISGLMQTSQRYAGQANTFNSLANIGMTVAGGMAEGGGGGKDGGVPAKTTTNSGIGIL